MKKLVIILLVLSGLSLTNNSYAKSTQKEEITLTKNKINVFVQTDRGEYRQGETIGIVCYSQINGKMNRDENNQSDIKISFVSQHYGTNGVIKEQILRSKDGMSATQITIPDTLKDGKYYICASTINTHAVIPITIGNKERCTSKETKNIVSFNPEGGGFAANVKNKVIVTTMTSNREGISHRGTIINAKGKKVAKFKTDANGLGTFYITPKLNEKYYTVISKNEKYPLPKVYNQVVAIEYNGNNGNRYNVTFRDAQERKLRIVSTLNEEVLFNQEVVVKAKGSKAEIPVNSKMGGVMHLSVWNSNKLVAQREIYIEQKQDLNLSVNTTKIDGYTLIKLKATDSHGAPIVGNFSASINKDNFTSEDDRIELPKMVSLNAHIKPVIYGIGVFGYTYTEPYAICFKNNTVPFTKTSEINNFLVTQRNHDYNTEELLSKKRNDYDNNPDVVNIYSTIGSIEYIATDENLKPILRFKTNSNKQYLLHKPTSVEKLYLFPATTKSTMTVPTTASYDNFSMPAYFETDNLFKNYTVVNKKKMHRSTSSVKKRDLYCINGWILESLPKLDSTLIISREKVSNDDKRFIALRALVGARGQIIENIITKQKVNPWGDETIKQQEMVLPCATIFLTKNHHRNNIEVLSTMNSKKTRTLYWNPILKTDLNGEATILIKDTNNPKDLFYHIEGVSNQDQYGAIEGKLTIN